MIHTSKQLKDKVRNLSKGDNDIAKALIRTWDRWIWISVCMMN